MKESAIFCILFYLCTVSCSNAGERKSPPNKPGKKELSEINSYLVQKDREKIQSYIERKKIPMKETRTGLWYYIIKEGTGKYFDQNDKVVFDYVCSLLDGTECYNTEKTGPKECILGKSDFEAGLMEGFHLLKHGSEAVFILPPFLAFGLLGDGKSIPSRAVVVYHIKIRN